ncbi:Y-family DNA polymerase [Candidatus Dojkabacteria bacterium]|uniref:Y-family DNA polymerase n=1 Tax=Candidatus Dojkabacteria bacterium TaxID=2099670 RepID=A0A955LB33_9BACT|nr:Y-family DNA polymerase [Candidatus Dojkabacteria bacterium]
MKQKVFALIDCNNFFASCERVFNPALVGKPIAILSNNDGCIIARSAETKKLGIPMGAPFHKWKDLIEQHNVKVFSANFHLYGDLSNRVMNILGDFAPDVQVYSIDEAFLDITNLKIDDYKEFASKIKKTIMKWTGVPVSVGIAPTKTLAKIATEEAKQFEENKGTYVFNNETEIDNVLKQLLVYEIWGIGYNLTKFMNSNGIYTAYDLKQADETWLRAKTSVTVQRTQFELRSIHCIEGVENKEIKKHIISSRSFSHKVTELNELKESVASYIGRAAEKLRKQNSICSYVGVSLVTFQKTSSSTWYHKNYSYKSYFMSLDTPTDYTPDLISAAESCVDKIFIKGLQYKKSLVELGGILPKNSQKVNLFDQNYKFRNKNLVMNAYDEINKTWGSSTIKTASMGTKQTWKAKSNLMSPRYTTSWDELKVIEL